MTVVDGSATGGSVLAWKGELDLANIDGLRADIDAAVADMGDTGTLTLDLDGVSYMDSLGLSALIHARNQCQARGVDLVIRGASDRAKRLIAMTGLTSLFTFADAPVPALENDELPDVTELPATPDPMFDQIAALTRRVIGVPIALVSLVDRNRQVFPGASGLPDPWQRTRTTPLTHSFCQYVVLRQAPLVLPDATVDPEYRLNLAIPDLSVVAYAGMPITDVDGNVVGSLCAIDTRRRDWTEPELKNLADLAAACSSELQKRGSERRAAISVDRERIARDMHERVIGQLFNATLALGKARGLTTGHADELVASAVETIDGAISTIRATIFDSVPRPQ